MKIRVKDVEYVARLARLTLSDEEKDEFAVQLNEILTYMDKLNELDTKELKEIIAAVDLEKDGVKMKVLNTKGTKVRVVKRGAI